VSRCQVARQFGLGVRTVINWMQRLRETGSVAPAKMGGHKRSEKKVYASIDELQVDLDEWIRAYNESRPHQGRWCFGKTPMQTFLDAMPIAKEEMIAA
jgi:hypothetical protein